MSPDILELLADAPDGACAVDMGQKVVFWNSSAERILGFDANAAVGRQCYDVVHGRLGQGERRVCVENCAAILLAREGKVPPYRTVLAQTSAGRPRWITTTHMLIPGAPTELSTLLHLFHEASKEVRPRRSLQGLRDLIARETSGPAPADPDSAELRKGAGVLSPRERDVLRLLALGYGTGAIAEELSLSPTTVRNHIQRILPKLGVHSRLEAVVAATRLALL